MSVSANWREHYERMLRWQARATAPMSRGETRDDYNERVADMLHALFVTSHHLVDWLANDPSTELTRKEAEKYVHGSHWLKLCVDFANGSKHAVLRKARIGGGTVRQGLPVATPGITEPAIISIEGSYFEIEVGGKGYDAPTAANGCISEWESFLRERGLLRKA